MHKNSTYQAKQAVSLFTVTMTVVGLCLATSVAAAPPQTVTYHGTRVTTAVPGKPFTIAFQVKNTGSTSYSGVHVIFHVPKGITSSKVAPANAIIVDDTISWVDVPLEPGKSFYPSFTFTVDSGTPLQKKYSFWVEVTGTDMEATSTNFSITTRATSSTQTTASLSSADITSLFTTIYGRTPTASELKYWLGRRTDKPGRGTLQGAMGYHKNLNITH